MAPSAPVATGRAGTVVAATPGQVVEGISVGVDVVAPMPSTRLVVIWVFTATVVCWWTAGLLQAHVRAAIDNYRRPCEAAEDREMSARQGVKELGRLLNDELVSRSGCGDQSK
jgi:hypothetical protein